MYDSVTKSCKFVVLLMVAASVSNATAQMTRHEALERRAREAPLHSKKAADLFTQAIVAAEKAGIEDVSYARALQRLGSLLLWEKKYDKAEAYLKHALPVIERLKQRSSAIQSDGQRNELAGVHASVLHCMGTLKLRTQLDTEEADRYATQALSLYESCYGPESDRLEALLWLLMNIKAKAGRHDEMEGIGDRLVKIVLRDYDSVPPGRLGGNRPLALLEIGLKYQSAGHYHAAIKVIRLERDFALRDTEHKFTDPTKISLIHVCRHLGDVCEQAKDYEGAREAYLQSARILVDNKFVVGSHMVLEDGLKAFNKVGKYLAQEDMDADQIQQYIMNTSQAD